MKNINIILNDCGFVRETELNLLSLINQGNEIEDIIYKIIPEKNTRTKLFGLSVYLYGFKPIKRKFDFDFYFYCDKTYEKNIYYERTKEYFTFSYKYDPINDSDWLNPCHFIFTVRDREGVNIPRNHKGQSKSEQNKNKAIASFIFEEFLIHTVCLDSSSLRKWDIKDNYILEEMFDNY